MSKGILLILDGYGEAKPTEYNAVTNANTPFLHFLRKKSYSLLGASGESVGLTSGELGGSEVGHSTIGSGRINKSTFNMIEDDYNSGEFDKNKVLVDTLKYLKDNKSNLHIIGMMSDKNVHSNIKYTIRVVELAKSFAKNIFVHFITDGRDTPIHDSIKYLKMLRKSIKSVPNCHIISVSGRYFSMDRESYFDRIDLAFDAMFSTKDEINEDDIETYLVAQHKAGIDDQYVRPKHVYCSEYNGVQKQDVIMFTNFREDRMVEMVKKCESLGTKLVTFIQVGKSKTDVLYKQQIIKHTLSEYLSNIGLKQVKISETTKYAHVTYFMNGGREEPFKDEDRIHIKTRKIENLDKKPKMRAKAITTSVIKSMKNGYDAIIVNYSNPDMIGHTGNYIATKKALEYLDICVAKVVEYAKKMGYFVLITADHGNSEEMRTKNGEPHTAHTLNPVMCVEATSSFVMKKYGGLKDIAPTFLDLMGVSPNKYFEGETLIKHLDNQD